MTLTKEQLIKRRLKMYIKRSFAKYFDNTSIIVEYENERRFGWPEIVMYFENGDSAHYQLGVSFSWLQAVSESPQIDWAISGYAAKIVLWAEWWTSKKGLEWRSSYTVRAIESALQKSYESKRPRK